MRNLVVFCILVLVPLGVAQAQIPTGEREALIDFFVATNPDFTTTSPPTVTWIDYDGWWDDVNHTFGPPGSECDWFRVGCDAAGEHVIWLELWNNNLKGELLPSIGDLPYLEELWLKNNQISGVIPAEIGDLTNLETLYLFNNQLTGEIPIELGQLSNLTELRLFKNQLSGSIPWQLSNLPNLRFLWLQENQLSGAIPPELGNLPSLTWLDLSSNQLTGEIPAELASIPFLSELSLGNNRLTGIIPPVLGSVQYMWILNLNDNQLDGTIPPDLGNLGFLRQLNLGRNRLEGHIPPELGDIASLERIYLESNRFMGQIPVEIANTNLWNHHGIDLRWNAFYNTDPDLQVFLFTKQIDDFWEPSQTTAPTGLRTLRTGDHTVELSWDPVTTLDTYEGGFEAFYVPTSGGSWMSAGRTPAKNVLAIPVTGLNPDVSYGFAVATYTKPHADNSNEVLSEIGEVATETTTNTGCAAPVISMVWDQSGAELTVDQVGTYEWSTGETTQSITVSPTDRQYYWVWVTMGACTEADIIFVEPELFKDGFESGDTTEWSLVSP